MNAVKVESGVCVGVGGSNARVAICENGEIRGFKSVPTPQNPDQFFGWLARQALGAADDGHTWLVAGYPGLVKDGKLVGPMANVPGLSRNRYDVAAEMTAADPAVGRLLDEGFRAVNINDGNLAAQAAASRIGRGKYSRVMSLIDGTGVGTGVVNQDTGYPDVYHVDETQPYEIGHLLRSADPFDTFENAISGPALERAYKKDPCDMAPDHPAWKKVGENIGMLAILLGNVNGADLVVPCGGVGAGASDKYGPHLEAMVATYKEYGNDTQKLLLPEIVPVPAADCQVFELYGAEGVMADYLSRAA